MEPILIEIYHAGTEPYPCPCHCGQPLKFGYPESECEVCKTLFSTDDITDSVFKAFGKPVPSSEENALVAARVLALRKAEGRS